MERRDPFDPRPPPILSGHVAIRRAFGEDFPLHGNGEKAVLVRCVDHDDCDPSGMCLGYEADGLVECTASHWEEETCHCFYEWHYDHLSRGDFVVEVSPDRREERFFFWLEDDVHFDDSWQQFESNPSWLEP